MSSLRFTLYQRGAALLAGRGLRRYAFVNRLNSRILRFVRPSETKVLGHRMLLDKCDSLELAVRGVYEPLETQIACGLIPQGGVVVDIGANIGYYTLLAARAVGATGQVYAFEPEPENFSLLVKNLRLNGYAHVQAQNAAVSDATGTLKLFVSSENKGDHRVYDAGNEKRPSVTVRVFRLDDYFADDIPQIDLLKMDIQGAEGRALEGMRGVLLSRPPRAILTEFWPLGLRRAGSDPSQVLTLLEGCGYTLSILDEHRGAAIPVTPEAVLREFTESNGNQTNLLALHD